MYDCTAVHHLLDIVSIQSQQTSLASFGDVKTQKYANKVDMILTYRRLLEVQSKSSASYLKTNHFHITLRTYASPYIAI